MVTEAGEVELRRAYYYCEDCGQGVFPLDDRWGLTRSVYSPGMAQQMVWLVGAASSYELAEEGFGRIGHRHIPKSSIWRQVAGHGARLTAYVEHQRE